MKLLIQGDSVARGPKLLSINSLGFLATESPCSYKRQWLLSAEIGTLYIPKFSVHQKGKYYSYIICIWISMFVVHFKIFISLSLILLLWIR